MTTATIDAPEQTTFGQRLREQTCGVRLACNKITLRKTMTPGQVQQVAGLFNADAKSVNGSRVVVSRSHPLVAPCLRLLRDARSYLDSRTIDFPEQNMRLVRVDRIDYMVEEMAKRRLGLEAALAELDAGWADVKAEAKERLADLYSESDYPVVPSAAFGLVLSFPAIAVDKRLEKLNPELYAQEQARITARFDDAVRAASAAAAAEAQQLLRTFVERLQPGEDGKKKRLHASALDNIRDFVERFRETTIGSDAELEAMVAQIEELSDGVDVTTLRKAGPEQRNETRTAMEQLLETVDKLVEKRPTRQLELDD